MVKCRSLVPLGACSVGTASVTPPPATTSSVPPLERTISVLPAGTGSGPAAGTRGFLVRRRQDDRRLAGIERRRHPGIDPDIGRRQHAVPVERRRGAQHALVAGGDIGRDHQHRDQRAQRPGIVDRQPRRRQAGADALDRCQCALALRLPQRQRDRILRGQRIGQRGRRAMADAGAAVQPAERRLRGSASETGPAETARPAPAARTGRGRWRAPQTAAPATIRSRTPPETVRRRSTAAPDAASFAPTRSRILPAARPASAAAAKRHQGRALALTGRGWRRSIKLSGLPKQHPSTTAAMRHPFRIAVTHTAKHA